MKLQIRNEIQAQQGMILMKILVSTIISWQIGQEIEPLWLRYDFSKWLP
jgi:hypothetical protein